MPIGSWTPLKDLGTAFSGLTSTVTNTVSGLVGGVTSGAGSLLSAATPLASNVANSPMGASLGAGLATQLGGGTGGFSGGAILSGVSNVLTGKATPVLTEATFFSKLLNMYKLKTPAEVGVNGKTYLNYDYDAATGKRQINYITVAIKATVIIALVVVIYKFGKKKRWF